MILKSKNTAMHIALTVPDLSKDMIGLILQWKPNCQLENAAGETALDLIARLEENNDRMDLADLFSRGHCSREWENRRGLKMQRITQLENNFERYDRQMSRIRSFLAESMRALRTEIAELRPMPRSTCNNKMAVESRDVDIDDIDDIIDDGLDGYVPITSLSGLYSNNPDEQSSTGLSLNI